MLKKGSWKDILIGVLVAYVAVEILVSYSMRRKAPTCIEKAMEMMSSADGVMVVFLGVLIGLVAWYLSSRAKEGFKIKKAEESKVL